jgi:hypothetical protein
VGADVLTVNGVVTGETLPSSKADAGSPQNDANAKQIAQLTALVQQMALDRQKSDQKVEELTAQVRRLVSAGAGRNG